MSTGDFSSSVASCSVICGGGDALGSSRCGDISGLEARLWGSGTAAGSTSSLGAAMGAVEISSMFFFWTRSNRDGRVFNRGRRPSCIQWSCCSGRLVNVVQARAAEAKLVGHGSRRKLSQGCHCHALDTLRHEQDGVFYLSFPAYIHSCRALFHIWRHGVIHQTDQHRKCSTDIRHKRREASVDQDLHCVPFIAAHGLLHLLQFSRRSNTPNEVIHLDQRISSPTNLCLLHIIHRTTA